MEPNVIHALMGGYFKKMELAEVGQLIFKTFYCISIDNTDDLF